MKAFYTCILTLFSICVVSNVYSQGEPQKKNYENVVIEKDGNTYIQKSLPLYLKFSTTPDGKNYNLKSKNHPEDTSPMYLDTEGPNYIRSRWAVDPTTGQAIYPQREVIMELYADGMPPRTTLRFSGAPRYASGGTIFYGRGLSFSLSSTDAVSGVKETMYSLGGGYQPYGASVAVPKEGAQTVYFYSADFVGNAEDTRSNVITVDITAPTSLHEILGIVHNGNILAPSTTFRLTSIDNLAGVRSTYYNFDGGSDRAYTGNISLASLPDGDHTLSYHATDNVRNEAASQSFKFYLDKIPPVVENAVVGDQYRGNHLYVSARTKVKLTASDNKAGVNLIYYRIDGGERINYSNEFNFPNSMGTHSIKYDATDNVQNLAPNKYLNVYMDNRAPETGIDYGRPQFFHRDTLFITSNTPVTLIPRDPHSGIQNTMYSIDGGSKVPYSQFTLPNQGYHTVTFSSKDNVNNQEQDKKSGVFVDNTPPDLFVNFSIQAIGSKGKLKVYPNYVRMYIGATDKHTGTDKVFYSIDDGALTLYSSPQTLDISELSKFKKRKKYSVKVVGEDKLGNKSEKVFEFYVGLGSEN